VRRPIKRSERWSILPALSNKGYLDYVIFQGSITAEIFLTFLIFKVLPKCVAGHHVLVLDNASIHRAEEVQEACNNAEVELVFLPPYSPDFNPIEATFKDLKAWLKLNFQFADDFVSFENFLYFAVEQMRHKDPRGHFRTAGYQVIE
jgi:transposase